MFGIGSVIRQSEDRAQRARLQKIVSRLVRHSLNGAGRRIRQKIKFDMPASVSIIGPFFRIRILTHDDPAMGVSMKAYAAIETGGKQYRVEPGDVLQVELLSAKAGETVNLQPVLALCDGTTLLVGNPHLADAKVTATVLRHLRGPKLIAYKKKRRKGYARKKGHRQELTELKIEGIQ